MTKKEIIRNINEHNINLQEMNIPKILKEIPNFYANKD